MTSSRRLLDSAIVEFAPAGREYTVHDSVLNGFGLRIRPAGGKTWILRVTLDGTAKRVSLGDATQMRVREARARAYAVLSRSEPARSVASRPSITFAEYAETYRSRRIADWKPATVHKFDSGLRLQLMPRFQAQQLGAITRAEVARWFHDFSASSPGAANRILQTLKPMFTCARDWGLLPENHKNPCKGIQFNRRNDARGRMITEDGLAALGIVLERHSLRTPDAVDVVRLLILTSCRSGEILKATWAEVRRDRLVLNDSKTGPRTVMLGVAARKILAGCRRRRVKGSKFVFPSQRFPGQPRGSIYSAWRRFREEAGLPDDIRPHDCRHTFASHAIMGGETMLVTSRLLGHRKLSSTARYSHLQDNHLLAAAERIARRIDGWLGEPGAKLDHEPADACRLSDPPNSDPVDTASTFAQSLLSYESQLRLSSRRERALLRSIVSKDAWWNNLAPAIPETAPQLYLDRILSAFGRIGDHGDAVMGLPEPRPEKPEHPATH